MGNGKRHQGDKTISPVLQYAPMKTISEIACYITFPAARFRKSICAKGDGMQSICGGDSGGPLIDAKSHCLIGIASYATGCDRGLPQGFTQISLHLPWIKKITGITCKR